MAKVIETTVNGSVLTVVVQGQAAIIIDAAELADNVRGYAMVHGIKQRVIDAAAISRNADNGASATPAEKYAAMRKVADALVSGKWGVEREAAGSDLCRAMREAFPDAAHPASAEAFAAWITASAKARSVSDGAIRNALAGSAKIKPIMDRLAAERGKGVDADALLDDLTS